MAAAGTWLVPTIGVTHDQKMMENDRWPEHARTRGHAAAKNHVAAMHACAEAGVGIATGADLNPIGPRLHAELAMLETAGLTRQQVLYAATVGGRALNGLGDASAPGPWPCRRPGLRRGRPDGRPRCPGPPQGSHELWPLSEVPTRKSLKGWQLCGAELMKDDLVGRVALVTGGGSGIGRGISLRLGQDGAVVAVLDVDGERAASVASEIKSGGGCAVALSANVGVRAEVQAAVTQVLDAYRRVDILVNNAGVIPMRGLFDMSDEIWAQCFTINVTGVFVCSQIVSAAMVERSIEGRIVNIASVESVVARRQQLAYAASKGAVLMLTKATAA